jgi:FtsP/CotA-like multicopper oxidase with cupredoxin domain
MKRKYLAFALVALLLQSFAGMPAAAAALAEAKTQAERDAQTVEEVKVKVARLGVGERARVTVKFKDGTKLKGYISQVKDDEFIVRDRKTDAPTVVLYRDVARVESNRGHSTARNVAVGTAIGVGSVLTVLGLLIASLDD